ncbi:helix-turn-helix transcriptional regulator [Bacteroidales bacterium OttesenSCG-928-C19]|nr:helix-turn-helix transcriptional regulator [Bacteroidales bacterium OttesenSCG-928-C19]
MSYFLSLKDSPLSLFLVLVFIFLLVQIPIYFRKILKEIKHNHQNIPENNAPHRNSPIIAYLFLILVFVNVSFIVTNNDYILILCNLIISLFLGIILFVAHHSTDYSFGRIRRSKNICLNHEIINQLYLKLLSLFENDFIYRKPDLSIDDLAEMLNTNRTYVSYIFSNYCNHSFYQFIHNYRIAESKKLLVSTNTKIEDIAYSVGYKNFATFCRNFKEQEGCSARKWRNIYGELKSTSS